MWEVIQGITRFQFLSRLSFGIWTAKARVVASPRSMGSWQDIMKKLDLVKIKIILNSPEERIFSWSPQLRCVKELAWMTIFFGLHIVVRVNQLIECKPPPTYGLALGPNPPGGDVQFHTPPPPLRIRSDHKKARLLRPQSRWWEGLLKEGITKKSIFKPTEM